jgi:hypothetical protein
VLLSKVTASHCDPCLLVRWQQPALLSASRSHLALPGQYQAGTASFRVGPKHSYQVSNSRLCITSVRLRQERHSAGAVTLSPSHGTVLAASRRVNAPQPGHGSTARNTVTIGTVYATHSQEQRRCGGWHSCACRHPGHQGLTLLRASQVAYQGQLVLVQPQPTLLTPY